MKENKISDSARSIELNPHEYAFLIHYRQADHEARIAVDKILDVYDPAECEVIDLSSIDRRR